MPEVEQVDREAAAGHHEQVCSLDMTFNGKACRCGVEQAFAAHRLAERARIVAAIRDLPACVQGSQTAWIADAIERGQTGG